MKQVLEELTLISGVMGGYSLHSKQGIGTNHLPVSFNQENLADVNRQLMKIFSACQMNLDRMKDLSLHYDGLVIYLRHFAEQEYLIVVCEPTVNTNVLSMSVSLAVNELSNRPMAPSLQTQDKVTTTQGSSLPFSAETVRTSGPLVADLETIEEALAGVMGPMSEMILDDAIEEWFQTVQPSYKTLPDLINILSREIGEPQKTIRFQATLAHYGQG